MSSSTAVTTIDIQDKLPKVASGKVRDLYAIDDTTLLFVASDRISAYDVTMENVRVFPCIPSFSPCLPPPLPSPNTQNMR